MYKKTMNKERDPQLHAVYSDNGEQFFGFSISAVMCTLMSHKSFSKIASTTKRTNASDTLYPIPRVVLFSSFFACVINRSHRQNDFAQCNMIVVILQCNKRTTYVYHIYVYTFLLDAIKF